MKEYQTIEKTQLLDLMKQYQIVYDIVRLVEPDETTVLLLENGSLNKKEMEPCFAVWDRQERCQNCVSQKACADKRRMTKFEFRDDEIYSVVAMPFLVKDGDDERMLSMELVNHVTEDMVVQTGGHGRMSDELRVFEQKMYRDSLTGTFNRRYYDEKRYVYEIAHETPQTMGFIVIDINKFKHVNDAYGHVNGDDLLLKVATALKSNVRESDRVIRVGGDEFLVVVRDCSRVFVEKKMRQLKKAVSEIYLPWAGEFRPSIAAGTAFTSEFNGLEEQVTALFQEADRRMYENKSMPVEERKTMLLVDDIELNRILLRGFFEKDFVIYEAADGVEALSILKEKAIEIVITDIYMPNMDGFALIREIRKNPDLDKIVVFAVTDRGEELELQALEAGADDFINKPFNMELLSHRIKGVLSQNTVFNRISQYQLSFNQNQIPFATVRAMQGSMTFEYVNDAFAQLMDGTPGDFISGRKQLHFEGFQEFVEEVSATHQRKQIHVFDESNGKYYDVVAYAQDNGFCSFIIFRNDALKLMKDSENRYEIEFKNIMSINPDTLGAFFVDLNSGIYQKGYGSSKIISQIPCPIAYEKLVQVILSRAATEEVRKKLNVLCDKEELAKIAATEGQNGGIEAPFQMLDGTVKWLRIYVRLNQNENSDSKECILYFTNVHDQKISQLVMDTLAQKNLDMLFCIDVHSRTVQVYIGGNQKSWSSSMTIEQVNKEVKARLRRQYVGEDTETFIQENTVAAVVEKMRTRDRYTFHYIMREEDGKEHEKQGTFYWLDSYRTILFFAREDVTAIVEKETWNRVNTERIRYQTLLNQTSAMITVIDAKTYEILYANNAAIEVTKDMKDGYIGSVCHRSIANRETPCEKCLLVREDGCKSETKEIPYGSKIYRMTYKIIDWNGRKALLEFSEDITDQKKVIQLMQENQKQLDSIINNVPAGIIVYKVDNGVFTLININPAACRMMALAKETTLGVCGEDIFKLVHPEDVKVAKEAARRLCVPDAQTSYEFRSRNKVTGLYRWMVAECKSVLQADGSLLVYTSYKDINERKEKEQTYQQRIAYLTNMDDDNLIAKGLNNITKNSVVFYDKKTECAVMQITNSTYDDMLSALCDTVVIEKQRKEIKETLSRDSLMQMYEEGITDGVIEYRRKQPDGKAIWASLKYLISDEPITHDVIVFLYSYDSTEQIQESQIVNRLSNLEYDTLGLLDVASHRYKTIYAPEQFEGAPFDREGDYDKLIGVKSAQYKTTEETQMLRQKMALSTIVEQLAKSEVYYVEYPIKLANGESRRIRFRYCYLDDTGETILYLRDDITESYERNQKQLRDVQDALNAAKKASQAKTEFFSRMSHDMRTPMNGILGLTSLSEDEEDKEVLKENIIKIRQSGQYLLGLINDTLDFQRIESGKMTLEPQIVNTKETLENIIDMVRQAAKAKGVKLLIKKGNVELDCYVRIDPMRIKQIFINLLSNAVKFTPEGGSVEFAFDLIAREGMISHDRITIKDTGIGMSKEFLENGIFRPFSQENNSVTANYAGSGLGLSIAKSLIELMGGRIEVESELGVGTTFTVYLDFERINSDEADAELQKKKIQKTASLSQIAGRRILLVEDQPLNAEIAKRLLEKVGCQVKWSQNGEEALNCFELSAPGTFDAILMDIRMPVMDGLEATRRIRALNHKDASTVPIIAMTANAYDTDIRQALDAGMNAHLAKPIEPAVLYTTISDSILARNIL